MYVSLTGAAAAIVTPGDGPAAVRAATDCAPDQQQEDHCQHHRHGDGNGQDHVRQWSGSLRTH